MTDSKVNGELAVWGEMLSFFAEDLIFASD
jgi:hypothetical protein